MATIHIDRLLETVIKQGASDLHITVGRPPVIRLHGHLRSLETKVLAPDDTSALMKAITPERNQQELQEEGGTDFAFAFGDAGRFRVSVFKQKGNVAIVLRLIPAKLLTFEDIGLPNICRALCRRPRGMFLVTGPTGSGKTTTLATMLDYINKNLDRHIVCMEDPIEYFHSHKKSIINQREIGIDVPYLTFVYHCRATTPSGWAARSSWGPTRPEETGVAWSPRARTRPGCSESTRPFPSAAPGG